MEPKQKDGKAIARTRREASLVKIHPKKDQSNIKAISRHEDAIMSKIKAIHTLKESIIEQKFRELCVRHSSTLEPGALMPQQYSWTRFLSARIHEKFDESR